MSNSEGGKIADALVTDLNAGSFSKTFTCAVKYGIRLKLEDADTLHVDVAPAGAVSERHDRGTITWKNAIDIGVRYRFGTTERDGTTGEITTSAVDAYRYLLQEIVTWCYANPRLSTYTSAVLSDDVAIRADVIQKHFDEWNQFTAIARVIYQTDTEMHP
jgi:hypothetical protein